MANIPSIDSISRTISFFLALHPLSVEIETMYPSIGHRHALFIQRKTRACHQG